MSDIVGGGMNMNDDDFRGVWSTLAPTVRQRRRIDGRVFEWLEASDTSLAAEWLGLFQIAPISATGLVAVSAVAIVISIATAPQFIWLARVLL